MGANLNKLMQSYGVYTPTVSAYSGVATPDALKAGATAGERGTYQGALADYAAQQAAFKGYETDYKNRISNTNLYTSPGPASTFLSTPNYSDITGMRANLSDTTSADTTDYTNPNFSSMINDAYRSLGRVGIGTDTSNIDQPGYNYWMSQLQAGANGGIAPRDFKNQFKIATNDYIKQKPDDDYTKYIQGYLGILPAATLPVLPTTGGVTTSGTDVDQRAGEGPESGLGGGLDVGNYGGTQNALGGDIAASEPGDAAGQMAGFAAMAGGGPVSSPTSMEEALLRDRSRHEFSDPRFEEIYGKYFYADGGGVGGGIANPTDGGSVEDPEIARRRRQAFPGVTPMYTGAPRVLNYNPAELPVVKTNPPVAESSGFSNTIARYLDDLGQIGSVAKYLAGGGGLGALTIPIAAAQRFFPPPVDAPAPAPATANDQSVVDDERVNDQQVPIDRQGRLDRDRELGDDSGGGSTTTDASGGAAGNASTTTAAPDYSRRSSSSETIAARQAIENRQEAFMKAVTDQMAAAGNTAPSQSEMWFRLASAFLSPTKTGKGAFGESVALASRELADYQKSATSAASAKEALKLQTMLKTHEITSKQAIEGLKSLERQDENDADNRTRLEIAGMSARDRAAEQQRRDSQLSTSSLREKAHLTADLNVIDELENLLGLAITYAGTGSDPGRAYTNTVTDRATNFARGSLDERWQNERTKRTENLKQALSELALKAGAKMKGSLSDKDLSFLKELVGLSFNDADGRDKSFVEALKKLQRERARTKEELERVSTGAWQRTTQNQGG